MKEITNIKDVNFYKYESCKRSGQEGRFKGFLKHIGWAFQYLFKPDYEHIYFTDCPHGKKLLPVDSYPVKIGGNFCKGLCNNFVFRNTKTKTVCCRGK